MTYNKSNNNQNDSSATANSTNDDTTQTILYTDISSKRISSTAILLAVQDTINTYYSYNYSNNAAAIMGILDESYVEANKISQNNVYQYLKKENQDFKFFCIDAYEKEISFDHEYKYWVYGITYSDDYKTSETNFFEVNLDQYNSTFKLIPHGKISMEEYKNYVQEILKNDNGGKRKLSKRKDPEAAVEYYKKEGIPSEAVKEYLLNIANSTFENWRKANPDKSIDEFDFQLNKMSVSGALFDMIKLLDIGKTVISKMTAEEVYNYSLIWAKEYDEELAKMLEDKEYALKVFGIERGNKKPRKDISKWSDVMYNIGYMYDDEFYGKVNEYPYQVISDKEDIAKILDLYISKYYNESDDKQTWFDKIKELAVEMGYAGEVKEFKANPGMYKAHVGDVSTVLRVALTARTNTPDMYEIMQVLGKNRIAKRLEVAKENLK